LPAACAAVGDGLFTVSGLVGFSGEPEYSVS